MSEVVPLDPSAYHRHAIHGEGRIWAETNCYTDVVLELLHGLGHEPTAALAFTLTIDFDLDQWTFFKLRHADVEALYGLAIHELAPWRPLVDHLEEQVAAGRPVLVELDSFFLPDTAGTAYRIAHVKSTVAVNRIDVVAEELGYFHNQGYHELKGRDFLDIFQVEGLVHPRMLPPYIEFVKPLPGWVPLAAEAFVAESVAQLRHHLARRPAQNPFRAFRTKFAADLDALLQADIEHFHAYSFATLRQYGACFELAATYLEWLAARGVTVPSASRDAFLEIARSTKAFQFQLARAMARRRPLDLAPLDEAATRWDAGMQALDEAFLR